MRGTAGWTGSLAAGRCGRIGLEILKNKQYGADQYLGEDDIADLKFLRGMVRFLPPKEVLLYTPELGPLLLYTDASYEQGTDATPGVGWVLIEEGRTTEGRTLLLSERTVSSWQVRDQQIFPAESFVPLVAMNWHMERLRGRDVFLFIDNEAAVAAHIRCGTSAADVRTMIHAFHWQLQTAGVRVWIEWIDSDSNPSDGLSRLGCEDPWTVQQGWSLAEIPSEFPERLLGFREALERTLEEICMWEIE